MSLPDPNDPLVRANGNIIEQVSRDDGSEMRDTATERRAIQRFSQYQPHKLLAMDQMPEDDHRQQVVISAIIAMRLMGLSNVDMALMLSTDVQEINNLMQKEAVQLSYELMLRNIVSNKSSILQGRITAYADTAIDTVHELMTDDETRADVRLKAAQDVLDRSGTGADHFFSTNKNDNHGASDELNIVVLKEEDKDQQVSINIKRK